MGFIFSLTTTPDDGQHLSHPDGIQCLGLDVVYSQLLPQTVILLKLDDGRFVGKAARPARVQRIGSPLYFFSNSPLMSTRYGSEVRKVRISGRRLQMASILLGFNIIFV